MGLLSQDPEMSHSLEINSQMESALLISLIIQRVSTSTTTTSTTTTTTMRTFDQLSFLLEACILFDVVPFSETRSNKLMPLWGGQRSTMVSKLASGASCPGFDSQHYWKFLIGKRLSTLLVLINGAGLRKVDRGLKMLIQPIKYWLVAIQLYKKVVLWLGWPIRCHWTSVMPVTLVVLWVSYEGFEDSWEQGKCPISKLWALMPTTYHVMPWWTQWRFCFESHNRLQRQNYFDGNVMKLFWYLGIHNFVRIMLKAKCQNLIGEQSFDSILRIF